MREFNIILSFFIIIVICCNCSRHDTQMYYAEAHSYYLNGELTKAVSCYLQCISYISQRDNEVAAYAYRDMASICHMEGNNQMAYEINERSVEYFERAGLYEMRNFSLCFSAVYQAYAGKKVDAVTQLRHIKALSSDTVVLSLATNYIQLLQSNQFPVLNESQIPVYSSELYASVQMLIYELYRKPIIVKTVVSIFVFLLIALVIYSAHSDLLKHLYILRREKNVYRQQYANEVLQFCSFLQTHPEDIKKEISWGNFGKMSAIVNVKMGGLIDKLSKLDTLNETEKRLCVLVLIDLPRNVIADILPYAPNSIGKLKNTVSKKLQTDGKNLRKRLLEIIMNTFK